MIGYTRVSTVKQAKEGQSLQAQRDAIQQEADKHGWEIIWLQDAGISATANKRPGLTTALHLLSTHQADGLVVNRLDRLARSTLHFATILNLAQDEGWNVVVLTLGLDLTTSSGKLMANILASIAEFERDLIIERTHEGLQVSKAQGKKPGRLPHQLDGATVDRLTDLASQQPRPTYAAMAHALTLEGYALPTGKHAPWSPTQVARYLSRIDAATQELCET